MYRTRLGAVRPLHDMATMIHDATRLVVVAATALLLTACSGALVIPAQGRPVLSKITAPRAAMAELVRTRRAPRAPRMVPTPRATGPWRARTKTAGAMRIQANRSNVGE